MKKVQSIKRQIVLDTETTGLSIADDHRIIEIGCVELINRRMTGETFHHYINPERDIDSGAIKVHGITNDQLLDKPKFIDVADDFLQFIEGAELIIHNAEFDVGFLDHELAKINAEKRRASNNKILDTLKLARELRPGQKNTLDALCQRYGINNANRTLHGALLDAELLAEVYLAMTGGQVSLSLTVPELVKDKVSEEGDDATTRTASRALKVIYADEVELAAHEKWLSKLDEASHGHCVWLRE